MKPFHRFRDRLTSRRLPVRIPVPNRDNLIAMGLTALALGLIVGVAIGPALSATSNAIAGVAGPAPATPAATAATTADTGTTDSGSADVSLGAPTPNSSASSATVADTSTPDTDTSIPPDTGTDGPVVDDETNDETPSADKAAGDDSGDDAAIDPPPQSADDGTPLSGVVVGVKPDSSGYDVADSSGNVLSLHAVEPPTAGTGVRTHIDPLSNGTYGEVGDRDESGTRAKARLRGVVSWLDPAAGLTVLSSRGSSLVIDTSVITQDQAAILQVGSTVQATVSITPLDADGDDAELEDADEPEIAGTPELAAVKLDVEDAPSQRVELTGKVDGIDPVTRLISISADSYGLLSADVMLTAPKNLDLSTVSAGRIYNATATINDDRSLLITGMSPDYSRKSADDAGAAFGDQR